MVGCVEVATWEHANVVLMAAMDCLDDTKFLAKVTLIVIILNQAILNNEIINFVLVF